MTWPGPHSFHREAEQSLLEKQIAENKLVTERSNYNPAEQVQEGASTFNYMNIPVKQWVCVRIYVYTHICMQTQMNNIYIIYIYNLACMNLNTHTHTHIAF